MQQTRIFATTDEVSAIALLKIFEQAFEDEACPVSANERTDVPSNWDVSVYANSGAADETADRMTRLAREAGFNISVEREVLPEVDWVAETLRELSPVRAASFVIHGSHARDAVKPHETGILIDAGLAFGTGHHGTTAGCLDMYGAIAKRRKFRNILDLGTGSGVLAIAAAKSSNGFVLASDIDPVATATAHENVKRNGVASQVECITATGLAHRRFGEQAPFDLVIANILARPLQSMAGDIARHMEHGAVAILSGLLPHQKAAIVSTFRVHGLRFERAHYRDGWMTLVLGRD